MRDTPPRALLLALLLATPACGADPGPADPDAAPDPDAAAEITSVTVTSDAAATDLVEYLIAGPDGALTATVTRQDPGPLALEVPVGGSITEQRHSTITPSLNTRYTTTGVRPGDVIDFSDRSRLGAPVGTAQVQLQDAPAGATFHVVTPCASGTAVGADVTLQLYAGGCAGWLVAVTVGDDPQVATAYLDALAADDVVTVAGPWAPVARREVTIAGVPATAEATFHAALFDGPLEVTGTGAQPLDAAGAAQVEDVPGAGLDDVEWVVVGDRARTRTWSARRPTGDVRTLDLLPALAAPTLDAGRLAWTVPDGVAADAPAMVTIGQGWWLVAPAGGGEVVLPALDAWPPTGATVTVIDAGVTSDDVRRAPRLLSGVGLGDGWALAGFDATRTTSARTP